MAPKRKQQYSGLQKRVLSLLRECLREARQQPTEEARHKAKQYIMNEFRRNAKAVKRTDIGRIEHLMRQTHRQLKLVRMPGVVGFDFGTTKATDEAHHHHSNKQQQKEQQQSSSSSSSSDEDNEDHRV
eukprot:gb/GECG01013260.1/.p1 GENE.gb/GECG01013260.1/~~gb/GECG01013260.1/.p1  ORF type:complete len:128 (+),score=23.43 gb/GECG01013260.1/:1-384(+)